jgi:hypothetical protein
MTLDPAFDKLTDPIEYEQWQIMCPCHVSLWALPMNKSVQQKARVINNTLRSRTTILGSTEVADISGELGVTMSYNGSWSQLRWIKTISHGSKIYHIYQNYLRSRNMLKANLDRYNPSYLQTLSKLQTWSLVRLIQTILDLQL